MRVVIVEDSKDMLDILGRFVRQYFDDVTEHAFAITAVKDMRTNGVDILVCDLNLSGFSGVHVMDAARCVNSECAIVVCSGGSFGSLDEFKPASSRFFRISKPFTYSELRWTLYKARESLPSSAAQPTTTTPTA